MNLLPLRAVVCSFALFLIVSSAAGQQPRASEAKSAVPVKLPAWLEKLNLSPQQKAQAEKIVSEHDAQFAATWQQFGERYQETLRTEALVLATIEENLTEAQRRELDTHRDKLLLERVSEKTAPAEGEKGLGIALTPEQEALGRKIQEKFQARLSILGNTVQQLHNRLLSIEMDKLVDIEKILTKEQREQLSQNRQAALASALQTKETP